MLEKIQEDWFKILKNFCINQKIGIIFIETKSY